VDEGLALQKLGHTVAVKGGVGLLGFYAGPGPHIIDKFALVDPLLARLPMPDARHEKSWRPGHFTRPIPDGYVDSLRTNEMLLLDTKLGQYNRRLEAITRGPLFSAARLVEIARMNLGLEDHLLDEYIAYADIKKVHIQEIAARRAEHSPYSWWVPGPTGTVEFTSTGLLVQVTHRRATTLSLDLTPGSYRVAWWDGRRELARTALRAPAGRRVTLPIPVAAQDAFDGVLIRPDPPVPGVVALRELSLVR
jgi:hypothetical protein